jgi:hypothetical protein
MENIPKGCELPKNYQTSGPLLPVDASVRFCRLIAYSWRGFKDALRSHCWNDSRQLVTAASSRARNSALLRSRPPVIASIFRSRSLMKDIASVSGTTISTSSTLPFSPIARRQFLQGSDYTTVVPVMNHAKQKVGVCSLWNRGEEVAGDIRAAPAPCIVAKALLCSLDRRCCIENRTGEVWSGLKNLLK